MTAFNKRRWVAFAIVLALAASCLAYAVVANIALRRVTAELGWMLLLSVFALAFLGACKKLSAVSVGTSRAWLQLHIYVGLLSVALFALHTGLRVPDGYLEIALFCLYCVVAGSGLAGLGLSRMLPRRLSARGEEVIFERIPIFMRHLREHSEGLVVKSVKEGKSTVMADFYRCRLARFFAAPRGFWAHILGIDRACAVLIEETRVLDRYLDEGQRAIRVELEAAIQKKDELDFHFAGQAVLKYWLFVHVPLSYGLLIVSILHVFIVYAFSGAAP